MSQLSLGSPRSNAQIPDELGSSPGGPKQVTASRKDCSKAKNPLLTFIWVKAGDDCRESVTPLPLLPRICMTSISTILGKNWLAVPSNSNSHINECNYHGKWYNPQPFHVAMLIPTGTTLLRFFSSCFLQEGLQRENRKGNACRLYRLQSKQSNLVWSFSEVYPGTVTKLPIYTFFPTLIVTRSFLPFSTISF